MVSRHCVSINAITTSVDVLIDGGGLNTIAVVRAANSAGGAAVLDDTNSGVPGATKVRGVLCPTMNGAALLSPRRDRAPLNEGHAGR
jgi:hypothetical protein